MPAFAHYGWKYFLNLKNYKYFKQKINMIKRFESSDWVAHIANHYCLTLITVQTIKDQNTSAEQN